MSVAAASAAARAQPGGARPAHRKRWIIAAIAATVVVAIAAVLLLAGDDRPAAPSSASFVGSEACAGCHQAELAPDDARYAFVYALGLKSSGRPDDARAIVRQGLARHPDDRDLSALAAELGRQQGTPEAR